MTTTSFNLARRRGVVSDTLDPELIVPAQGSYSAGATEAPAGQVNLVSAGALTRVDFSMPTIIGKEYALRFTVGTAAIAVRLGQALNGNEYWSPTANVNSHMFRFVALTAMTWVRFSRASAGTSTISAMSMRKS